MLISWEWCMKPTSTRLFGSNPLPGLRGFLILPILVALFTGTAFAEVVNLGAHRTDVGLLDFQQVIDETCSKCHTRERVDIALAKRKEIGPILQQMNRLGADISPADQALIEAFWSDANFAEVNRVIATRCTQCHSRERIDQKLMEGADLEKLMEKMLRFGARLSDEDRKVLGVFSGQPLR